MITLDPDQSYAGEYVFYPQGARALLSPKSRCSNPLRKHPVRRISRSGTPPAGGLGLGLLAPAAALVDTVLPSGSRRRRGRLLQRLQDERAAFPWKRSPFQFRSSRSSSAQTSNSWKSAGELLAIRVIAFCRHARLTWQGWQAQPLAWGGPSRLANISK